MRIITIATGYNYKFSPKQTDDLTSISFIHVKKKPFTICESQMYACQI